MILVEIEYKIYNIELLIIIQILKNKCYYLEDSKNNVLVLINYNN